MSEVHVDATGHAAEPDFSTKAIWKTFWILLAITLVELILAIVYYETQFLPKHFLNGLFVIGTLAKAFFIIAEFMHLRHEVKNLIMTLVMPTLLFVWFLIAFLWDGNSYKNLRNKYDSYQVEKSKTPAAPAAKKPGGVE
jgi:cytochrome c oxidase subunit IV